MMFIPEWIYTIDILVFFVVLLAVLRGVHRGFYRELAGVIALILLVYAYYFGYAAVREVLGSFLMDVPSVHTALSIIVLIVLTLASYLGLRVFCEQVLMTRLGVFTDQFSGLIMGFVRGVVIWVVLLAFLSELPSDTVYEFVSTKSVVGQFLSERLAFLSW